MPVVMCRSYGPALKRKVPYNISMIELEQGVRIWSNVVGSPPEEVKSAIRWLLLMMMSPRMRPYRTFAALDVPREVDEQTMKERKKL